VHQNARVFGKILPSPSCKAISSRHQIRRPSARPIIATMDGTGVSQEKKRPRQHWMVGEEAVGGDGPSTARRGAAGDMTPPAIYSDVWLGHLSERRHF